ncbi:MULTISPECIES: ParB/RepB/Spo0J family partition protein [Agrobacterium]|nr:ParB/RepB/Spo0J family partition protein [Agrobacterium larrymoorei]NSZ10071.1 ParB/RepB/Spo0J family partition protein [Agrobacterium tumefaciens]
MSKQFEGLDFTGFDTLTALDTNKGEKPAPVGGQAELPIGDVIEDPNQPRKAFDDDALKELSDSITARGVLQSIVVRPKNRDGKYVIVMGARRYRASLLAKRKTIPAIIRVETSDGYDQMIENIQREALSHKDTAAFISGELEKGVKPAAIASSLGKPRAWVSLYVDFFEMAPVIQDRAEDFGMRTAYELHKAYQIDAEATEAFLNANDSITQHKAIAFAKGLKTGGTGVPSPSISGPDGSEVEEEPAVISPEATKPVVEQPASPSGKAETSAASSRPKTSAASAIVVKVGESFGRLLLETPAEQGSKFGTVSFDNGAVIKEVALSELEIFEIIKIE